MDQKILAFGPLTRSPEQGREGGVYNGKKNFSSFLDELDHLEQFKHVFQKSHYPGGLAGLTKSRRIINEIFPYLEKQQSGYQSNWSNLKAFS